jgi:hypothetical protein
MMIKNHTAQINQLHLLLTSEKPLTRFQSCGKSCQAQICSYFNESYWWLDITGSYVWCGNKSCCSNKSILITSIVKLLKNHLNFFQSRGKGFQAQIRSYFNRSYWWSDITGTYILSMMIKKNTAQINQLYLSHSFWKITIIFSDF